MNLSFILLTIFCGSDIHNSKVDPMIYESNLYTHGYIRYGHTVRIFLAYKVVDWLVSGKYNSSLVNRLYGVLYGI